MQKFYKINFWLELRILVYIIAYLSILEQSRDKKTYPLTDRLSLPFYSQTNRNFLSQFPIKLYTIHTNQSSYLFTLFNIN